MKVVAAKVPQKACARTISFNAHKNLPDSAAGRGLAVIGGM